MHRIAAQWVLIIGLAASILAGCVKDPAGVASVLVVSTVEVTPPSGSVIVGSTLQLSAVPKTEGGIVLPTRDVSWSSTSTALATVDSTGLVTAHAIGGPVRIRATLAGVSGETVIAVIPMPIAQITVTPSQNALLVGQSAQLTARALDAAGNPLTGRVITWSSAAPGIATVSATGVVQGIGAGGPVTVSAASEGKIGTASVTVSPRTASRLGFLQQPGTAVACVALSPAIRVAIQDNLLGTVSGATAPVTLSLLGGTSGAVLSGTRTVAAVNGVATFANLGIDRPGTGYTMIATSPELSPGISVPFAVAVPIATRITITTQPSSSAEEDQRFPQQPVVQLRDAAGNPVCRSGVAVTVSIHSGPSAGKLKGTTTVTTNASGVAVFTNVELNTEGVYTLKFSSGTLTPAISGQIVVDDD